MNPYTKTQFLKSAARVPQLPEDVGFEVAFAGRSNAGKSTALNCLTMNKHLARTSKTPGRTQLINLFTVIDTDHRLVDLPGYGYAQVPLHVKHDWQEHLAHYLEVRQSLCGLVLLMDCRHPLKELDRMMIQWALNRRLALHIVLTKADKLSRSQLKTQLNLVKKTYEPAADYVSVQTFSALTKEGLDTLVEQLNRWFQWGNS